MTIPVALALMSISITAKAVGGGVAPYLLMLTPGLQALLTSVKTKQEEYLLLAALSSLVEATKEAFFPAAKTLVPIILSLELTETSLEPLILILEHIPSLVPLIEERVLQTAQRE